MCPIARYAGAAAPLALQWAVSTDAYLGAHLQHQLAGIYLLVDEPEKPPDQAESLLKVPYFLSPGWLQIEPTFAPLKGDRRFEKLVAGH
jgi:hypothetical protein